jgi:hypothetical protein
VCFSILDCAHTIRCSLFQAPLSSCRACPPAPRACLPRRLCVSVGSPCARPAVRLLFFPVPPFRRHPPDSVGPPQWSLDNRIARSNHRPPRSALRSRNHARSSSRSGRIRPLCLRCPCRQQCQPIGARHIAMPAHVRSGRNDHRLVIAAHGTALRDRTLGLCLCRRLCRLCRVRPPSLPVDGAAAGRGAAATKGYHGRPHRNEKEKA